MMKKEVLERYIYQNVVIGIPHQYKDDVLFYHTGNMIGIDDENIVIRDGNEEMVINMNLIKSIKADCSEEN